MICDPLPVKFLPQKNCWFGPKIALFSVVNCPGAKNGVIKNFCCTKKWPRRGQKIKKKFFFSEKIFERWEKKILGPLGPYLPKIDFGGQGGADPRSLPHV